MVDENKVKLMTRIAIYEKHEKNRNLVMSKYYKNDYVRLNVLKTWVASTVVYWLVFGCYIFMQFDDLLARVNDIDYFALMYDLLECYVVVCLIYFLIATVLYNYRYLKAKDGLVEYNANLKDLIELEGGPLHRGKVVSGSNVRVQREKAPATQSTGTAKKNSVNKAELVKNRQAAEERKKQEEIKQNVEQRNARIAARNEAALRQQRQMEADRQRIRAKREELERQQRERIRREQLQNISRENHTYKSNSEGGTK